MTDGDYMDESRSHSASQRLSRSREGTAPPSLEAEGRMEDPDQVLEALPPAWKEAIERLIERWVGLLAKRDVEERHHKEKSNHEAACHSDVISTGAPKALVLEKPKVKEPSEVKQDSNPGYAGCGKDNR